MQSVLSSSLLNWLASILICFQPLLRFPYVNLFTFSPPQPSIHFQGIFANYFTAIAREYGDGVTGKAVSTYFERTRKDPNWQRTDNAYLGAENGSAKKSPTKRGKGAKKATPAKGSSAGDDEEESFESTPSKKTPLNKVKNGRVTKASGGRAKAKVNYQDDSDDDEEELIKDEDGFEDLHIHNGGSSNGGSFDHEGHVQDDDPLIYYPAEEDIEEA